MYNSCSPVFVEFRRNIISLPRAYTSDLSSDLLVGPISSGFALSRAYLRTRRYRLDRRKSGLIELNIPEKARKSSLTVYFASTTLSVICVQLDNCNGRVKSFQLRCSYFWSSTSELSVSPAILRFPRTGVYLPASASRAVPYASSPRSPAGDLGAASRTWFYSCGACAETSCAASPAARPTPANVAGATTKCVLAARVPRWLATTASTAIYPRKPLGAARSPLHVHLLPRTEHSAPRR